MVTRFAIALLFAACIALPARAQNEARLVRVVYIVPKDRSAWPEFGNRVDLWLRDAQWYFACQMNARGFGYRTFDYKKDAAGRAEVVTLRSDATMDQMLTTASITLRLSDQTLSKYLATLPPGEQRQWQTSIILLFRETLRMDRDGSISFGATRGGSRRAWVSSCNLRVGAPGRFASEEPFPGSLLPELVSAPDQGHQDAQLLREPLKLHALYGRKPTIGHASSRAYGALMHELGHALGLPHTGEMEEATEYQRTREYRHAYWLMRTHYNAIHGNFLKDFTEAYAGLAPEEASKLASGPFFWRTLSDVEVQRAPSTGASPEVGGRCPRVGKDGKVAAGDASAEDEADEDDTSNATATP